MPAWMRSQLAGSSRFHACSSSAVTKCCLNQWFSRARPLSPPRLGDHRPCCCGFTSHVAEAGPPSWRSAGFPSRWRKRISGFRGGSDCNTVVQRVTAPPGRGMRRIGLRPGGVPCPGSLGPERHQQTKAPKDRTSGGHFGGWSVPLTGCLSRVGVGCLSIVLSVAARAGQLSAPAAHCRVSPTSQPDHGEPPPCRKTHTT
jgi:hypothetical protein